MSYRGCGGGGFRGFGGGGRSGGRGGFYQGPPERVVPLGNFSHACQGDLVVKSSIKDVPEFNAPLYLENKLNVGKIDEIFGNIKEYYISVKLSDDVKAKSFEANQQLFIDPAKLLPLSRFLPQSPGVVSGGVCGGGRGVGGSRKYKN